MIIGGKSVSGHGGDAQLAYVGVDPGAHGGLAIIYSNKVLAVSMPTHPRRIYEWLQGLHNLSVRVCLEKVGGYMPGGRGNIGSAMFNFGVTYGWAEMAVVCCGYHYTTVTPNTWQRTFNIPARTKGEGKAVHKNRLKEKAREIFPEVKVTLATADALLLAEYARRHYAIRSPLLRMLKGQVQ